MKLVIVESPSKAKTINKYLGDGYQVIASYGHIRDLPSKTGSVSPENDFAMHYEITDRAKKHVKAIKDAAKNASMILLATDPDREGEAISWHISEIINELKSVKKSVVIKRVAFNEITKRAVLEAVASPREIDMNLVRAQQARLALDYLVGFTLSPILWRKLPGSKSAGRVQSVALRLICEREDEIERFISREYWDIKLALLTGNTERLMANLTHLQGKKLDKFDLVTQAQVAEIEEKLKDKQYVVKNIEKKQMSRQPSPPFTTSSMQQEAARKLGFSVKYTMQVAQKLYEGIDIGEGTVGLITYMRTDGVQLAAEAVTEARKLIVDKFGQRYLPASPRFYKTKAKNAQEAHEAIRPTNINYFPEKLKSMLEPDQYRLYDLIWKRMMACQMENAIFDLMSIIIESSDQYAGLRCSGSNINFDGFYKLYHETKDDENDEEQRILPHVAIAEQLKLDKVLPEQHFTEAPPRYNEASLVKKMEELGIGRPSTHPIIISVLQERQYVVLDKKRFMPEERGRLVTAFLTSFFNQYVQYDFTSQLEDKLDEVSAGQRDWKNLLTEFWNGFDATAKEVSGYEMTKIMEAINGMLEFHIFKTEGNEKKICPLCNTGSLSIRLGKFGSFIACSEYPTCKHTRQIGDTTTGAEALAPTKPEVIGVDAESGLDITKRTGPYGLYLQIGEEIITEQPETLTKTGKVRKAKIIKTKPKRITIPSFVDVTSIDLPLAKLLLSLPREIGLHPETGKMIKAGIGRFGAYLLHDEKFKSIKPDEDVLTIGINRAVDELAKVREKAVTAAPLKVIGNHPKDNEVIAVYTGKYGTYIKYKKLNASVPKGVKYEDLTVEQALNLIKEAALKKKVKKKKS
jgi:DNA topoisomerase-1